MGWIAVALVALLSSPAAQARPQEPPYGTWSQSSPNSLRHLRFSPDGQYVLAQDGTRITLLSVQPFGVLFRIPAESATLAEFSPDSQEILFVSSVARAELDKLVLARSAPHVERWSIAQHRRSESTEIRSEPCGTLKLSPDGRILGCVDFEGRLRFVEVATGGTIFQKRGLCRPYVRWGWDETRMYTRQESGDLGSAGIEFSLDGRYVLAAPGLADGSRFGWDFVQKKEIKLRGGLRAVDRSGTFIFVAADRALTAPMRRVRKGVWPGWIVAFPSGKILLRVGLPGGENSRAADPDFVIFRYWGVGPAVALEYRTGHLITTKTPVLDVLGNHYVAERTNGELGLYERGKASAVATVRLDGP